MPERIRNNIKKFWGWERSVDSFTCHYWFIQQVYDSIFPAHCEPARELGGKLAYFASVFPAE